MGVILWVAMASESGVKGEDVGGESGGMNDQDISGWWVDSEA